MATENITAATITTVDRHLDSISLYPQLTIGTQRNYMTPPVSNYPPTPLPPTQQEAHAPPHSMPTPAPTPMLSPIIMGPVFASILPAALTGLSTALTKVMSVPPPPLTH